MLHKGFDDPSEFNGSIEDTLIVFRQVRDQIKKWIIETLFSQIDILSKKRKGNNFYFNLNLSPHQLKHNDTIKQLIEKKQELSAKTRMLVNLELTESYISSEMTDINSALYLLTNNNYQIIRN